MSFFKELVETLGTSAREAVRESLNPVRTTRYDPTPSSEVYKRARKEAAQVRRRQEEKAWELHPVLGSGLQTLNNIGDTVENLCDSFEFGLSRALFAKDVEDLTIGDHLFVQRIGYTHHGIYVGDGRVVHYLRDRVSEDSLTTFADGAKIQRKSEDESPLSYSQSEAAARARRRVGESDYNLIIRNCENFVRWCRNGLDSWS